jgi:hypothetical protein
VIHEKHAGKQLLKKTSALLFSHEYTAGADKRDRRALEQ